MALLCRFVVINQSFQGVLVKRPSLSPSFQRCPYSGGKLTHLPLLSPQPALHRGGGRTRSHTCSSSSLQQDQQQSMDSPPQGYRKNVGICLINPSKKVFAASRLDIPDAWQMPQGGIDEGEDPKSAAIRELKEETGVTSVEVVTEVPYWLTYDFPPEVREKLKRQWGSDWKGQAQKWFLLKLIGNEDEINLLGDGKEKPEFGEWSWMPPDQVVDLAVDFKRPVYKEVLNVFGPYLE